MAEFDVIIKDGTIIDGTRVPRYKGDLGIKDGKIAKIGRLNTSDAKKVLDARGLIVAPGGIDLHTHYDAQLHWDPYLTISSWARRNLGHHRQLRLRLCPGASQGHRAGHAGPVPQRSHPDGADAGIHGLGLGNLSPVYGPH